MKFFLPFLTVLAYVACQSEQEQLSQIAANALNDIKNIKHSSQVDSIFSKNVIVSECDKTWGIQDIKKLYDDGGHSSLYRAARISNVKKVKSLIIIDYIEIVGHPNDVAVAAPGILVLEPSPEVRGFKVKTATKDCYKDVFKLLGHLKNQQRPKEEESEETPSVKKHSKREAGNNHRSAINSFPEYWKVF